MSALIVKELDVLTNNEHVEKFEHALYNSFKSSPEGIFNNIWTFDHASQRARTLVPYGGQKIIAAELNGVIIGAAAMNLDMGTELQLEKYGFSVSKQQGQTAEGLALFSTRAMVGREVVLGRLVQAADVMLRSLGISILMGSCEKQHLLGYMKLGFRNIGKVRCNGQDEFLLQRTLSSS